MMIVYFQSVTISKDKIILVGMVWQDHVCIYLTETRLSFLVNKKTSLKSGAANYNLRKHNTMDRIYYVSL